MKACMGKVLRVDLGAGTFTEQAIPEETWQRYLGGIGLAASLLYDDIPAGADPLGPDNVLCFASGLLTGTGSVMTGRWMVACKSPLTGGWGDANCGGTLSPAIKQCGWDAILFHGIASEPLVFVADAKGPRLESAGELWGKDAIATEESLMARYGQGKKPAVAAIGPAAEKLSLISGISNDLGRYAARSGVGAVMGSKKLKALVLKGSKPISCADPEAVKKLSKAYSDKVRKQNLPGIVMGRFLPVLGKIMGGKQVVPLDGILSAGIMKKWGTIYNNLAGAVNGDSPMKNWGGSVTEFGARHYQKLDPDKIVARESRKYHCYSCVIGCGGVVDVTGIVPGSTHSHKPEYETACTFGPLCLNDDLDTIYRCNEICNRSGLDTISAGSTIAFAIECFENGVITKADTGGLELRWGDGKAIEALLGLMARREGFGDVLADGVRKAAERIGRGAERFAMHAGGQEPGMHDARLDPMMGVSFSADPTPGRHTISASVYYNVSHVWEDVPWAPRVTKIYPKSQEFEATDREADKSVAGACLKQVIDAAGGCLFAIATGVQHWRIFEFLDAATGEKRGAVDYMECGRRIQSLRQLFNVKHGLDPHDSIMSKRMAGVPPLEAGPLAGITVPIEAMVSAYWDRFGWDASTGVPLPATLEALGLPPVPPAAARLSAARAGAAKGAL
jgi:aldehyde:ferredoxin oxidoreductase